jgi:hypothetical protein
MTRRAERPYYPEALERPQECTGSAQDNPRDLLAVRVSNPLRLDSRLVYIITVLA